MRAIPEDEKDRLAGFVVAAASECRFPSDAARPRRTAEYFESSLSSTTSSQSLTHFRLAGCSPIDQRTPRTGLSRRRPNTCRDRHKDAMGDSQNIYASVLGFRT